MPARDTLRLKQPSEFRYIGKEGVKAIDGADIVNGRAVYGADVHFDGMLYATIARPTVYGGKVKSFDASKAKGMPGDQVLNGYMNGLKKAGAQPARDWAAK